MKERWFTHDLSPLKTLSTETLSSDKESHDINDLIIIHKKKSKKVKSYAPKFRDLYLRTPRIQGLYLRLHSFNVYKKKKFF